MIIAIGSTNPVKLQAVEEVVKDYTQLAQAQIQSFNVPSQVSDQPLSLEETIQGAKNRAKNAFIECGTCTYSFGIESGLMKAPGAQTSYIETSICSIFDGSLYAIGLSCGFEVPPKVLDLVLNKHMNLSDACYHAGITTNTKIGSAEGLIGILTEGRINRKEYTKPSIITALAQIQHAQWYKKA